MARIRPRAVGLIARREFLVRAGTRSFRIGTVILVLAAVGVALLPTIIRFVGGETSGDKIGVRAGAQASFDPVARFQAILDVPTITGTGEAFAVSGVDDASVGRQRVEDGDLKAFIDLTREADGDLAFRIVTKDGAAARIPTLLRQAAAAIAIEDRLARQGLTPDQQAALFAPATVTIEKPEPAAVGAPGEVGEIANVIVGQVLVVFIFLAIVLYGQWVAMSVAEEKSSRVIEIIINAASPAELLAGKVLGVGALGLTQYLAAIVPAGLAIAFQDQIASLVLGTQAGPGIDTTSMGLTPSVIVAFGIFFFLGFVLYAVLYAAAGSLVSRMEDVNSVAGPMMILGTAGYLVAVYASSGLIPIDATWVIVFSFVPFVSPFLMLSRVMVGAATPFDVGLAIAILVVTILAALWMAARVYSAGVLMYGQKAGFRTLFSTAFGRRA